MKNEREHIETDSLQNKIQAEQIAENNIENVAVTRDSILDDFMLKFSAGEGVSQNYATEEDTISEDTLEKIEKLKESDSQRLQIKNSLKERVTTGLAYLYNNTKSENFLEATNRIAGELMNAITKNNSIAIDVSALKMNDEYTFKHSVDVASMAMIIGKKYGLPEKQIYEVGIAGLLHDIGKTKVPNEILNKAGRLEPEEFAVMKQHALFGYEILKENGNFSETLMLGVLQHHEKLNGTGYPYGITREDVSTYAKIISVADIYDALVTERSYKKAFSPRDAVEMIMAMTDELDLYVVESFLNSVIIYPVGSTVTLSNGERARVVANNPNYVLRPKVVGLKTGTVYDLGEDLKFASIIIE